MTVLGEILICLSLITSPSLCALTLYKPPDSSWRGATVFPTPLAEKWSHLSKSSKLCLHNFLFWESQDFGQQHLYVIFKWPSTHSLKYIASNSAGCYFLSTFALAFILWDALRWPIWWMWVLTSLDFDFHFSNHYSLSLFTFMHWRRKWQPTPVFLPGESQGQGNLVGCLLWGRTESDTTDVT